MQHDYEYLTLVQNVIENGVQKGDRTGTGTKSMFGQQMRFDLSNGSIPLLTTKKMFTRGIIHEIIWYLTGDTNIKYLVDNDVHIWDEWADENGELGPVYGAQWRNWDGIDQVVDVVDKLKNNPNDRRIIISAWNVAEIPNMNLPPCHCLFQFWVAEGKLKCHLYQRSCDIGLGVPFNIVQYSILTHMFAQVAGLEADEFVWTGGDCHIYNNHFEQLTEQAHRVPYDSPTLLLNPNITDIDDFRYDDFRIVGYDKYHPTLKMDVAV